MITLSPTKARANLSSWLKRAAAGESVAILYQDQIIALRPIEVEALDYVEAEYQISNQKMSKIDKNLTQQSNQELNLKKSKQFKGNLEELI